MRSAKILFIACLAIAHWSCDTVEPAADPGTHPFFPYKVGDEFVVEEWGIATGLEFIDTITYRVVDVVKFNGNPNYRIIGTGGLMYLSDMEPLPRTPDTLQFRVEGSKIFTYGNVGVSEYIDFDAPYKFSRVPDAPMGFVKDTSVEVPAGRFDDCKLMRHPYLSFNFVYAKEVGFVSEFYPDYRATLLSANVGGRSYP